jgi:hypothetical protein
MVLPQKRQRTDNPCDCSPTKKIKYHHQAFWDNLSRIWLTPRALRELDRRTVDQALPKVSGAECQSSARFARHGGPDISCLRGVSWKDDRVQKSS